MPLNIVFWRPQIGLDLFLKHYYRRHGIRTPHNRCGPSSSLSNNSQKEVHIELPRMGHLTSFDRFSQPTFVLLLQTVGGEAPHPLRCLGVNSRALILSKISGASLAKIR